MAALKAEVNLGFVEALRARLLAHSSDGSLVAGALWSLFRAAGFLPGRFQVPIVRCLYLVARASILTPDDEFALWLASRDISWR